MTDTPAALAEAARALFGPRVAVAALDPRRDHGGLPPEEAAAIAGARAPRRREFAAGRVAARRAMAELGLPPRAVPSGPDRAPIWPAGLVGSIAHDAETCLAVLARADALGAIGVDIEPDQPLDPALWDIVCRPEERDWLAAAPAGERGRRARRVFSAKEAAYKSQYPRTGCLFGFETLAIEFDGPSFRARFRCAIGPFARGACLPGAWLVVAGRILTGVTLPPINAEPPDATLSGLAFPRP